MTDELPERSYSAFWPVLILLIAFLLSYLYQLYQVMAEQRDINQRYAQTATPDNLSKAKEAQDRLVGLWNDLKATAAKDQNAAALVQEINRQGIIRDRSNPSGATNTNAAPIPNP